MKAGWVNRLRRVLWQIFVNHFWGKVEGIFYSAILGLVFNAMEKFGYHMLAQQIDAMWVVWNKMGDIVGTYGLCVIVPSTIAYVVGYNRGHFR